MIIPIFISLLCSIIDDKAQELFQDSLYDSCITLIDQQQYPSIELLQLKVEALEANHESTFEIDAAYRELLEALTMKYHREQQQLKEEDSYDNLSRVLQTWKLYEETRGKYLRRSKK